jgi:hypothetical protein
MEKNRKWFLKICCPSGPQLRQWELLPGLLYGLEGSKVELKP